MRTRWFDRELDTIAMLWRVERRDGVALGFAAHDRDIVAGHVRYHAAPGMLPSAIEMDDGLDPLDMDIGGALSHDMIRGDDLSAGRWDHAAVRIGLIDWEQPDEGAGWFWHGHLGAVSSEGSRFSAELRGLKAGLDQPFAPAASPSCRAEFCGPGCGLARAAFEQVAMVETADDAGLVFAGSVRMPLPRWCWVGCAGSAGAIAGWTRRSSDFRVPACRSTEDWGTRRNPGIARC